MKKILPGFLFFLFFISFSSISVFADNLLQNPGFEELLFNWEVTSGLEIALNFTTSSYIKKSGDYSASIKHNKTDSSGAQQVIKNIKEGCQYLGKGYVFFNNENAKSVRIRIAWYSFEDGSGSQIKTVDSNIINTPFPSWQELDTGAIEAPLTAKSAKFRILLASSDVKESLVYFDDLSFEEIPSITPTSAPSQTPAPNPTSTPASAKTTYKINDVRDEDGKILSSVKIYVDEVYLHHYASETITFCDGCKCDTYVDCGFGQHVIKLEKSGYDDWLDTRMINSGTSYEVNPVMNVLSPTPTETPVPTNTPTPQPTIKISPTLTKKPTPKPTVLGVEKKTTSSAQLTKKIEPTIKKGEVKGSKTSSPFIKDLPKILILFGVLSGLAMIGTAFLSKKINK